MSVLNRLSSSLPGNGTAEIALAAVPTSLTVVEGSGAWIFQLHVCNTTAGALTFLVQDSAGNALLPTVSIAANQAYVMAWPMGAYMAGGFSVQAGGSGLIYGGVWRR